MARNRRSDDYDDDDDERPRRAKRSRKSQGNLLPFVIGGGLLLIAVVVGVIVVVRHKSSTPTATQAPGFGFTNPLNPPSPEGQKPNSPNTPTTPSTPAIKPFPKEPTSPHDIRDFGGKWPDFTDVPADTVVLHIHGVATPRQHDVIVGTRLEQIAPTQTSTGFVAGERRGEQWAPPLLTVTIGPGRDAEAFARKINFGRVVAVKGNVISISLRVDGPMPDHIARAIQNSRSSDIRTMVAGCDVLSEDLPENRRPEVQQAFERILEMEKDEIGMRGVVIDPYCKFATKDNVPKLLQYLKREKGAGRSQSFIMQALARLQDPRGVAPIAARLEAQETRGDAKAALIAYGPLAEETVLKFLTHQVADVRVTACDILGKIGTSDTIEDLMALTKDPVQQVRDSARAAIAEINKRN
jgi:hypothetical protein